MPESVRTEDQRLHPTIDRMGRYSWRLIGIAIVGLAILWLLRRIGVVVAAIVIALFFARILSPVAGWLKRHRWKPALAALASMLALLVVIGGVSAAMAPSLIDEFDSIGPTLTEATDDLEDWLVDDSPFNVSRESVDRLRDQAGDRLGDLVSSSGGSVIDGATLVAEIITVMILAVLLTFFMLRDGARFTAWARRTVRPGSRERFQRAVDGAWKALGAYLRGATLLGFMEAVIIGLTSLIAGGRLIVPVMLITFLAAFVPLVGAIVGGVVAVLIALVTGGTGAAIAVAIVVLIVQQLDNDLLSPIVYGRTLSLHPVVVLLSVVTGGALFGIVGTMLAVPVVAVAVASGKEWRSTPSSSQAIGPGGMLGR